MTRLVIAPERLTGPTLTLDAAESRYLRNVRRLKAGSQVVVRDGRGHEWIGRLADARTLSLGPRTDLPPEPGPRVHLCFSPPKGKRVDYLLEKGTEIGAASLIPVYTERSVRKDSNEARWQRIVDSAARQCGAGWAPTLRAGCDLVDLLAAAPEGLRLFADPDQTASLHEVLGPETDDVTILTGPEGGFSDSERAAIAEAGFVGISLGPRILRAETAPLVALTIVLHCSA